MRSCRDWGWGGWDMGSVWGPSGGLPMVQFVFFGLICDARDLFVLISVIGFIRKGANYKFTTAYKLKLHRRLRNSFGALSVKQICFKCPVTKLWRNGQRRELHKSSIFFALQQFLLLKLLFVVSLSPINSLLLFGLLGHVRRGHSDELYSTHASRVNSGSLKRITILSCQM